MGRACGMHGNDGYKIWVRKPEEKNHLEDLRIDGKIILEWILGK
jgi:hypothetical protein